MNEIRRPEEKPLGWGQRRPKHSPEPPQQGSNAYKRWDYETRKQRKCPHCGASCEGDLTCIHCGNWVGGDDNNN